MDIYTIGAETMELIIGEFPYADGFTWEAVEYFKLEYGVWQPYAGDEILPGPGLKLEVKLIP